MRPGNVIAAILFIPLLILLLFLIPALIILFLFIAVVIGTTAFLTAKFRSIGSKKSDGKRKTIDKDSKIIDVEYKLK